MARTLKSPTSAYKSFAKAVKDAGILIALQEGAAGTTRGKKHGFWKTLNRGAIFFLIAAWEAYVEDLCRWAIDYLLKKRPKSNKALSSAANLLWNDLLDASNKITGNNVKRLHHILVEGSNGEIRSVVRKKIKDFNTADSENTSKLIQQCTGIKNIEQSWKWGGSKDATNKKKLDAYLDVRHKIAHGRQTKRIKKKVNRAYSKKCYEFLERLVKSTDEAVVGHLKNFS